METVERTGIITLEAAIETLVEAYREELSVHTHPSEVLKRIHDQNEEFAVLVDEGDDNTTYSLADETNDKYTEQAECVGR